MAFLKRILGIKSTSANWCVLRDCAQEPLHFYWFRSAIKFWNRMVVWNSNTLRDVMKADISLGNSGASNCWTRQMKDAFVDLQNGTVYRSDLFQCRKLNISNLRIDLRFRHQAVWREAHGQDHLLLFKKVCGLSQLVCFAWEIGFWCTCTICLARVFEDGSEQKCHEERSSAQDSRTWVEVWNWFIWQESGQECTYLQFVWKRGSYSLKMRSTLFFHVSVPNIYGTSSSTYLIIFLKVISKVLYFNITQKFTNLLVQLSIFLIDLFVGTYRLSSHARLEAFVIQSKLN